MPNLFRRATDAYYFNYEADGRQKPKSTGARRLRHCASANLLPHSTREFHFVLRESVECRNVIKTKIGGLAGEWRGGNGGEEPERGDQEGPGEKVRGVHIHGE